jgi:hypothetical protein
VAVKGILASRQFVTELSSKPCWISYNRSLILTFIHRVMVTVPVDRARWPLRKLRCSSDNITGIRVVDMDLSKCFDRLDHDLIIASISKRVKDGSILKLIEMFLKGGVMIDHEVEATEIGSPQGGVISPLIANIYLDAFDQEMKRRGHRIVRYADDILILCATRSGAKHAQAVATEILEGELKLTVNREKTHMIHASQGVKFLGVEISSTWTRIQAKKVDGAERQDQSDHSPQQSRESGTGHC